MAFYSWNDSFSVGIKSFDAQHQELIRIINELHDAMRERKGTEVLGKVLDSLIDYTIYHFGDEEKLLSQHDYPGLQNQKQLHEDFAKQMVDTQTRFKSGESMLSIELMNVLKDWLTKHIKGTDKEYGPYLNSKGVE